MAHRKQNVFHGNAADETKNGKNYVPAIDNSGHDSEGLVAFTGGYGIGVPVWDKRLQKVVHTFEVLDALPNKIMLDSDYTTQNDVVSKTGLTIGTTESIAYDSDSAVFNLTLGVTADSDTLVTVNAGRSYIWSTKFSSSDFVIEGYATAQPSASADGYVISVKPTSSREGWKAAQDAGSGIVILHSVANKVQARGKTINDDKNRYVGVDSDYMFHDDIA
jgi:hypothetical protein